MAVDYIARGIANQAIKLNATSMQSFVKKSDNTDGSQTWTITWIKNSVTYPYDIVFPKGVSSYQGVFTSKASLELAYPSGFSSDKFAIVDENNNVYLVNYLGGTWNYKRLNNKIVIKKDSTNTNLCYKYDDQTDEYLQTILPLSEIKGDKGDIGTQGIQGIKGDKGSSGTQLNPKGAWDNTVDYISNSDSIDLVNYGGKSWIALANNTNKEPDVSPSDWALFYDNTVQGGLTATQEALINTISNKQNINEDTLTTTNKAIPLAINELDNNIKTNLTPHLSNYANPHKTALNLLQDTSITSPQNGQALMYDTASYSWKNGTVSTSDEKVKMTSADTNSSYLVDLLDSTTIVNENGKLVIKSLSGLTVGVAQLNYLTGASSNIQQQINELSSAFILKGAVDTKAALNALTGMTIGQAYVVNADESQTDSPKDWYVYTSSGWILMGLVTIIQRNFTTSPIDLTKEVTGILPLTNMDTATLATKTEVNVKTQINDAKTTSAADTYSIDKIMTLINNKQNKVFIQETQPTDLTKDNLWIDITSNSTGYYKFYCSDGTKYIEIGSSGTSSDGILTLPTETVASSNGQDTFIVATHSVNSGTLLVFVEGNKISTTNYTDIDSTHIQLNTDIATTIQQGMVITSLVIAKTNGIDTWIAETNYLVGKLVIYNNAIYQCKIENTDTTFTDSNWQLIGSVFDLKSYVDNTSYKTGCFVVYDKNIYQALVDNNDVAWTASHWQLIGSYIIQDALGSYIKRTNLKFIGNGVKVEDNSTNDSTIITVNGDVTKNGVETLSNKTLIDNTTFLSDSTDNTKIAQFKCSGINSGTTKAFTLPNKDGTIALTNDLTVFTGATSTVNGTSGFVPQPIIGQQNLFLRGDSTWAKPFLKGIVTFGDVDGSNSNCSVTGDIVSAYKSNGGQASNNRVTVNFPISIANATFAIALENTGIDWQSNQVGQIVFTRNSNTQIIIWINEISSTTQSLKFHITAFL